MLGITSAMLVVRFQLFLSALAMPLPYFPIWRPRRLVLSPRKPHLFCKFSCGTHAHYAMTSVSLRVRHAFASRIREPASLVRHDA